MMEIEVFEGLDLAKAKHAVAISDDGRAGEFRYFGEIGADGDGTFMRRYRTIADPA